MAHYKMNPMIHPGNTTEEEDLGSLNLHPSFIPGDYSLLTQSQEMQLMADQDVGSMMNNLLENEDWKGKEFIYEDDLLTQQTLGDTQLPGTGQYMYSVMPDVLPIPTNTVHPPVPSLVSNEDYPGPFDFELYISPQSGNKNLWAYSLALNKLFLAMSTSFPIDFKCTWPGKNLFIRATPIFSLAQHSQDLVTRCIAHSVSNNASNRDVPESIWGHVIRCQNSNAVYQGSVDDNIRLSVVLPLEKPQTGSDTVRILYMFVCKNSCPSGMNRRPFEVVFTLEDETGNVYGRHSLNIRVCSCPKRDKEKEEKVSAKENGNLPPPPPPPGKKKKYSEKKPPNQGEYAVDTKEYPIPWTICGKHNLSIIYTLCASLMAGDLREHGPNENIEKCLENLKRRRLE